MKEIREIVSGVSAFRDGERAILATVIDVRGSGYRLPGARMLMLAGGRTVGTVSGGCLEADVLERAKKVLDTGRAEVFVYDTTKDENSVFSMNMGCRGIIRILLEPVGRDSPLIGKFRAVNDTRERQVIATLVSAESDSDVRVGGRLFFDAHSKFATDGLPLFLADLPHLRDACSKFLTSTEACELQTFNAPDGTFEFALENIVPPISLLLFGAGADAVPMARIVTEVGWQVTVHDHRPAFLTDERFPTARKLVLQKVDEQLEPFIADSRTAAVIMTHNYSRDRSILPALLLSEVFYIGALGPKRRAEQLLGELAESGIDFKTEQLARLYAPVGLDIGADTPESIALSIAGEIQSVLANRNGGHLRDRKGSIYDRK